MLVGLGDSWCFALLMPSNKKRKSGQGKKRATMLEELGAGVKKGMFEVLVTPSPTLSPSKGGVE